MMCEIFRGMRFQMYLAGTALCLALLVYGGNSSCINSNWWHSLDRQGHSKCDDGYIFIKGFYRNDRKQLSSDYLKLLEEAECCTASFPWRNYKTQTVYADWWHILDREHTWAYCPAGYFLSGLYRSENTAGLLYNIEEARCSKPADHPPYYGHCYDQDISICFDNKGWCRCNDDYYVTGIYRSDCNRLYCLEVLRCCQTASAPEKVDELYKVKTHIMDTTMEEMATLAHYLGYAWCSGCRSPYVGEDFRRSGDTWYADKSGRCEGHMSNNRLNMAYGDWSFAVKDIKYGVPVTQDLEIETIDSGIIYNNDSTEATKSITRSETSIRSVTHTTTSSWKNGQELNLKISYTPPSAIGGVGVSVGYTFNYENSTSISDQTMKEQTRTFSVSTTKTLKPNSAVKWSLVLSKTRTSVAYTATVLAKFSTEFQGFMRDTNNHYLYHGSGQRPTINYRFGDSGVPFYTALRQQSETNSHTWLWSDIKTTFPNTQRLIDDLCDENRYVFTVSGMFDDVLGKHAEFRWDSVPLRKRSADRHVQVPDEIFQKSSHVAKAGPNDVPLVKLVPPVVKLVPPLVNTKVRNRDELEKLTTSG